MCEPGNHQMRWDDHAGQERCARCGTLAANVNEGEVVGP